MHLPASVANFNTFHAADVSRRQVKNVEKVVKNVNILEFGDYIWNHRKKCIEMKNKNMPGIDLENLWNFEDFD